MTWTAVAPVPMIATRLPVRSQEWSQRCVWITVPAKSSRPGMSGFLGSTKAPRAVITNRAVSVSPLSKRSRHRCRPSSHSRARTSVFNRSCDRMPYLFAQRSI
ncbi:Uncharacterised protein [Mycobacteroides abscessus subsp. abscessus]|nr:Uncharacterised protein [Mycobacteroides abscessus subsp. abscessus]